MPATHSFICQFATLRLLFVKVCQRSICFLKWHCTAFSQSTDVTSTDLFSAKGKCIVVIVVLIVLFWCFWCVKDYNVVAVYWNIVWWGCETISISWLASIIPFAETRSVKRMWRQLTERIYCCWWSVCAVVTLTSFTLFLQYFNNVNTIVKHF